MVWFHLSGTKRCFLLALGLLFDLTNFIGLTFGMFIISGVGFPSARPVIFPQNLFPLTRHLQSLLPDLAANFLFSFSGFDSGGGLADISLIGLIFFHFSFRPAMSVSCVGRYLFCLGLEGIVFDHASPL